MHHADIWIRGGTVNEQLCSLIQLNGNISLNRVPGELSQTTVKKHKLGAGVGRQQSGLSAFKMFILFVNM